MLSVLIAAGALVLSPVADPAPAPPTLPIASDDPDLRCMLAMSMVLGGVTKQASVTAEQKAGVTGMVMYYFGRVDAEHPGIDYTREITRMVETPGYVENRLRGDVERCAKEMEGRGKALIDLGQQLQKIAPLANTRPG